jgi:hypothetical protein
MDTPTKRTVLIPRGCTLFIDSPGALDAYEVICEGVLQVANPTELRVKSDSTPIRVTGGGRVTLDNSFIR